VGDSVSRGFVEFMIYGALDFLPFRAGGSLTANSWAPGVGGGRNEDDGEGNGDAEASPSSAIESRAAGDGKESVFFENKMDYIKGGKLRSPIKDSSRNRS